MASYFEFTDNGIKFIGFQEIRQQLRQDWQSVFGSDLDVSPTSPDGHHIDLEAKTILSITEALQFVTSNLNRSQASGQYLDFLASFLRLNRAEGETDAELRKRMNEAEVSGLATYNGMLTYLRDNLHPAVDLLENSEDTIDEVDGVQPHSVRVVVPEDIDKTEKEIGHAIWFSKPAGIKTDGNLTVEIEAVNGKKHIVHFAKTQRVDFDLQVVISRYSEEELPENIETVLESAIRDWAIKEYTIGKDVLPMRIYAPILTIQGIATAEISVKETGAGEWSSDSIAISNSQYANLKNITVELAN